MLQVPETDPDYVLGKDITRAILSGFSFNRRVMVHGPHGSGKSTHIEQIAARLNWPCQRINLDGQVSRLDLVGHDVLTTNKEGTQITEFRPGILTQALEKPVALVLDEYDAARADVLFVLQRLLEENGVLNLYEHEKVIKPHPGFRIFATANTAGQGDASGVYHGTQILNQGQLDRWQMVAHLDYMDEKVEIEVIKARLKRIAQLYSDDLKLSENEIPVAEMVQMAKLIRRSYLDDKLTTVMSPRTVLAWAEGASILGNVDDAFRLSYLNRCAAHEKTLVNDLYFEPFARYIINTAKTPSIPLDSK